MSDKEKRVREYIKEKERGGEREGRGKGEESEGGREGRGGGRERLGKEREG